MNPVRNKTLKKSIDLSKVNRTSNGMKNHKGFVRKNSQGVSAGFALIESLLILLIIGILGGVGYYVYSSKKSSEKSLDSAASTEITAGGKAAKKESDQKLPDRYVKYENKSLGISFTYPSGWGEVVKTEFDSNGNSDIFTFTKFNGLKIGGLQKDYTTPSRGGSLLDYGGYIKEGNLLKFRSFEDKSTQGEAEGYRLNTPNNCILATNVEYFGAPAHHATCNLNSQETFGFNFAADDTAAIILSDFLDVVNSVSIK